MLYLSTKYLRKRRVCDLQRILLCIINWFCIRFHGCFASNTFSIILSVVVFTINFLFRWSIWVWISSLSVWYGLKNLPKELEMFESRRVQSIFNKRIVRTILCRRILEGSFRMFYIHLQFQQPRMQRKIYWVYESSIIKCCVPAIGCWQILIYLKLRSTKRLLAEAKKKNFRVRHFVTKVGIKTREDTFRTKIAKLWTIKVRAL